MPRNKIPQISKKNRVVNVRFTEREFKKIEQVLKKQGFKSISPQIRVKFLQYIESVSDVPVN